MANKFEQEIPVSLIGEAVKNFEPPPLTPQQQALVDSIHTIAELGQAALRRGELTSPSHRRSTRNLRRNGKK